MTFADLAGVVTFADCASALVMVGASVTGALVVVKSLKWFLNSSGLEVPSLTPEEEEAYMRQVEEDLRNM